MNWTKERRVDTPEGFRFLVPPWWFRLLHPFGKGRKQGYASLAYIAYWMQHDPSHLPFKLQRPRVRFMANLLVRWYPFYWLIVGIRTQVKRLWGVVLFLVLLGIPALVGFLIGIGIHISITIH